MRPFPRKVSGFAGLVLLLAAANLLLSPGLVRANPATSVVTEVAQPDGEILRVRGWGDEFVHGYETLDGYTIAWRPSTQVWEYAVLNAEGALAPSGVRVGLEPPDVPLNLRPARELVDRIRAAEHAAPSGLVPVGFAPPPWVGPATRTLTIMVQFPADAGDPDGAQPAVPCSFTAAQMEANLWGATPIGPGNLTDYFDEISYGAFQVSGDVVGCFTVANDKNDYDDGPLSHHDLVAEAIALADPTVDFAPYDTDGDGEVDNVWVAYAGCGPDNNCYHGATPVTDSLWPRSSSNPAVSVDGGARTVSQYFIAPELQDDSPLEIRTIGVFAHEYGHKMGLRDLYDSDTEGIGHWGLMGSGSWLSTIPGWEHGECPGHMTPWSKWHMGWLTPIDVTGVVGLETLPEAENDPVVARLLDNPGGTDDWPGGTGEYFLVENRQRTGFDGGMDGCGVLIWHIDETRDSNADQNHRFVDLEEGHGGTQHLAANIAVGNRGDGADPYPGTNGQRMFARLTIPKSDLYDGSDSGVWVGLATDTCQPSMDIALGDPPPVAVCPLAQTWECQGSGEASGTADGSSSYDYIDRFLDYQWTSPTCTFDDPYAENPVATCPLGVNTIGLMVGNGINDSDPCGFEVEVEDTLPPEGEILSPAAGACYGPASLPVLVTDDFSDQCDDALTITYDPPGGPAYIEHGDYDVTVTASDASFNTASDSVAFTIDLVDPDVVITEPQPGWLIPRMLPFNVVIGTGDDDGVGGGVLHEVVRLDGCVLYDGLTYGDGDGLLSDEMMPVTRTELCRLSAMCGLTVLHDPVIQVEATDCGDNVGSASRQLVGSVALRPGLCGP